MNNCTEKIAMKTLNENLLEEEANGVGSWKIHSSMMKTTMKNTALQLLETSEHEPKRVGRKESRLLDYMEIVRARRETFIHSYRNRNWVLEKKRCIEKLKCIKIKKQLNNRRNRDSDCKDAPTKNKQSSKIAFACKL